MKNIHMFPTKKPSRLFMCFGKLNIGDYIAKRKHPNVENQYIYITSDEEIKDVRPHKGKWQLEKGLILNKFPNYLTDLSECKLIIMTTDQDLIKDGVQAIDDEFLEWICKNPSCEEVDVIYGLYNQMGRKVSSEKVSENHSQCVWKYKIIIPKEEIKLEDVFNDEKREGVKKLIHEVKSIPKEEILANRSNAYEFLDFDKQETFENIHENNVEKWRYKQETLKEAYNRIYKSIDFTEFDFTSFEQGAKWQQENSYSEEDMREMYNKSCGLIGLGELDDQTENDKRFRELISKFKNK